MAPRDQQRAQQNNQGQVAGAERTHVDEQGGNHVVQRSVYYVKLNLWMYSNDRQNASLVRQVNKLPYVFVYKATGQEIWTVIKANDSTGGIALPVENTGEYRLYAREPHTTYTAGGSFTIPYHALDNGTQSQRPVQAICGFTVTEANNQTTLTVAFPIEYPSRDGVISGMSTLFYPRVTGTHTLQSRHTSRTTPLVIGDTNGRYILSSQLWADICKAYGTDDTYIQNSTWRTVLEKIYSSDLEDEPTTGYAITAANTRVNAAGETVMLSGRILVFNDNGTERKIVFQDNSTEQARKSNSFNSATRMLSTEAFRRTHPCVYEYWIQVMHDLNMTSANITSTWRPNLGSMLHRYCVGLDIGKFTANVQVPVGLSTSQVTTSSVTADMKRANNYNRNPSTVTDAAIRRSIVLARSLFTQIATDKAANTLGWLGCPWAFNYADLGVTQPRGVPNPAIATDNIHADHLHISFLPNVLNVG